MAEVKSQWWWFESDKKNDATPIKRSPWLNSALSELDEKTKAMLKIIEEDADSFAARAEMYYKKRPELMTMVEGFYKAHRSLAERYDQLKADPTFRHVSTPWASSPLSFKCQQKQQFIAFSDKSYDSFSEKTYDLMEDCVSDVDDPEQENEMDTDKYTNNLSGRIHAVDQHHIQESMAQICAQTPTDKGDEVTKFREEIKRLKEENRIQKEKLEEKDEEKREVIRQLSITIDAFKEENVKLKKHCVARETTKKESPSEFLKLKDMFMGKLFKGSSK